MDSIKSLESFLFTTNNFNNINELIKNFTSKNGSKVHKNEFYKNLYNQLKKLNMFDQFESNDFKNNNIIHIHLKSNGKGKEVLHGVVLDNRFFVISMDFFHEFLQ